MRRLTLLIAPLATAVALVVPATTQAFESDHYWYAGRHIVEPGEKVPVKIEGLTSLFEGSYGFRFTCRTQGTEEISNEAGAGVNTIDALTFKNCYTEAGVPSPSNRLRICPKGSKPMLTAENLPWQGYLNEFNQDEFEKIEMLYFCSGHVEETSFPIYGPLAGLVGVSKVQFAEERGVEETGYFNHMFPDVLFTGLWHLTGPANMRAVTALELLA